VANGRVKEEITEEIKNAGSFYHLVRDVLWKWEHIKKTSKGIIPKVLNMKVKGKYSRKRQKSRHDQQVRKVVTRKEEGT
jgi:hypothetical protein